MTTQANESNAAPVAAPRKLRIWPAIIPLALVATAKGIHTFAQESSPALFTFVAFAPLVAGVLLALWWLFASRAPMRERLLVLVGIAAVIAVSYALVDPSLAGMGFMFFVVPTGVAAVALALIVFGRARAGLRVAATIVAAIIGFGTWDLARNDGIWGDFKTSLSWRWQPTSEERYLASLKNEATGRATDDVVVIEESAWPQFRGPHQDNSVPGVVIDTDWKAHPPKEIWRRPVGPGWSSFVVAGKLLFTQEQRGEVEVVACYDADTGRERWTRESTARFWESVAGAGPRATPTLSDGRLYAVGATGLVHCLNPATGEIIWQRDLAKDADRKPPMWGFSSSPLIVDDMVIVYAGGAADKGVFAYDSKTGDPKWSVPAGDHSYSTPHRATVDGRDFVLMLTNTGFSAIDAATGKSAWGYPWPYEGYRALQPLVVDGSGVVIGTGVGTGTRRVDVKLASEDKPQLTDAWTSLDIKPDFNDYVAHKGCLYGFDHNIFTCVDLASGKRNWKKGRYGNGQVLLLPDADQLLVLSEKGEVVVVRTNPKNLEELARTQVMTDKTWNHPVLVGNRLYVRNAEEAVCLELPLGEAPAVAAKEPESKPAADEQPADGKEAEKAAADTPT